jgi:hypothetical protein
MGVRQLPVDVSLRASVTVSLDSPWTLGRHRMLWMDQGLKTVSYTCGETGSDETLRHIRQLISDHYHG